MAALIANVNRNPKKRRQPFTPADFFTSLKGALSRKPKAQPWQQQLAFVEMLNDLFGGRDERKRSDEGTDENSG